MKGERKLFTRVCVPNTDKCRSRALSEHVKKASVRELNSVKTKLYTATGNNDVTMTLKTRHTKSGLLSSPVALAILRTAINTLGYRGDRSAYIPDVNVCFSVDTFTLSGAGKNSYGRKP